MVSRTEIAGLEDANEAKSLTTMMKYQTGAERHVLMHVKKVDVNTYETYLTGSKHTSPTTLSSDPRAVPTVKKRRGQELGLLEVQNDSDPQSPPYRNDAIAEADTEFGETLSFYSSASSNGLITSNGGKNWYPDAMRIAKNCFGDIVQA
ncbi:hypothetical protein BO70DRAFT_401095 [Aspergillus heteromorphus CBS 117.55]|uniref:Uncharacterized protein n=1 Tax=Aspergillus heteromorphus CBS 117.55 TaxID=1448321 RepID=A0A317UU87_9EURO|nr:uncharacterized protein BO70DRAFT_401095 [Aspergillus heteromorphus CBS 117.55]PWY65613.1 hypothetical protein BO70DRAFT_401095 [Aspergillus heteromorphus CBS 117.55]